MAEVIIQHTDDQEEVTFESEFKKIAAETHRLIGEMKQSQNEIERLRAGNQARLTRIEAALDHLASA